MDGDGWGWMVPVLWRSNREPFASAYHHRGPGASNEPPPPGGNTDAPAWPSVIHSSAVTGTRSSAPGTRASFALCWPPA